MSTSFDYAFKSEKESLWTTLKGSPHCRICSILRFTTERLRDTSIHHAPSLLLFLILTDSSHLSTESRTWQYRSCSRTKSSGSDLIFITVYPEKPGYLLLLQKLTSGDPHKKPEGGREACKSAGVAGVSYGNPGFSSPHFVGGVNVTLLPGNPNDSKNNTWLI